MHIAIERFISGLEPGDVVNLDSFEASHGPALRRDLVDEIEGRGFVIDSRGILGEVSICELCNGEGELKGRACPSCDGYSTTVNYGRGCKPFRQ